MVLFSNRFFWTILLTVLVSQSIKTVLNSIRESKLSWKSVFVNGGMPSSHSSLVSGLTVIIYLIEGLTTSFFISLSFGLIVIVDAVGVRRTAGEEGKTINKIINELKLDIDRKDFADGHTPLQALAGILLGIIIAITVYSI